MRSTKSLWVKLAGIVTVCSMATFALYAWLFPVLHIKTACGTVVGALVAGGLSFYWIKETKGVPYALVGSIATTAVVFYLSMLLILNTLGG